VLLLLLSAVAVDGLGCSVKTSIADDVRLCPLNTNVSVLFCFCFLFPWFGLAWPVLLIRFYKYCKGHSVHVENLLE
jgi:hypothetical protein